MVTQAINLKEEFPQLFTGLGKLKTEYQIKLNPEVELVSVHTPRKIPHPLLPKVKNEIDSMLKQGVISPVIDVTDWCFGAFVPVPKANGQIQICVDLTLLNKAVKREIHPMGSVDESLATPFRASNNLHHAIQSLLLQRITLWHKFCDRNLPTDHVSYLGGS